MDSSWLPIASTSNLPIPRISAASTDSSPASPAADSDLLIDKSSGSWQGSPEDDGSGEDDTRKKKKRKKLPACDTCKLRRVLCNPQLPPASCSRCLEKGIACTTTPVVRKKPVNRTGKRIEQARATFGSAEVVKGPSTSVVLSAVSRMNPITLFRPSISLTDVDSRLGSSELTGELTAHLLDLFHQLPQSWLPFFLRGRVPRNFDAAGRRLSALPPQSQVLIHTIMALTCRLSSHPLLLGPGPLPPALEALTPQALATNPDLREYGLRRNAACEQLRENAVRMAWENGTLVDAEEDSMASCFLLEVLEIQNEAKGGRSYGAAFASHVRALLEDAGDGGQEISNLGRGWSSVLMWEALNAMSLGRAAQLTIDDDYLLCGEAPTSLDEAVLDTTEPLNIDRVNVEDWSHFGYLFRPMRPFTFYTARLASECSDRLTGIKSRRQPLDERFLFKFSTELDQLLHLCSVFEQRIALVFSTSGEPTILHLPPLFRENRWDYLLTASLYALRLAWCSLSLPVYTNLRQRIDGLKEGTSESLPERRRLSERYEFLLKPIYRSTLKAARMMAKLLHNAPSLPFLNCWPYAKIEQWVVILLEAKTVEEGGEGITRAEKLVELGWMLSTLKKMGWSWPQDQQLISSLEFALLNLQLSSIEASTTPSFHLDSSLPSSSIDYSALYALGAPPTLQTPFDLETLFAAPLFGAQGVGDAMRDVFGAVEMQGGKQDWIPM